MRRFHRRSHGMKIPVALIAGFMPVVMHGIQGAQSGGITGFMNSVSYDMTGYNPASRSWSFAGLAQGWTPILIGLVVHKVAGMFGVNKMLASNGVPLIRI